MRNLRGKKQGQRTEPEQNIKGKNGGGGFDIRGMGTLGTSSGASDELGNFNERGGYASPMKGKTK